MANYLGWEITNKGRELLARAMNNETKINITKFKIGAGYNTGNDRELTDLLDKRNEFPINSYERKGNGNVEFTFIVSNKTGSGTSAITNSYKISEMGIYARDDFGTEILYAYNKGTDGDYIPVFNGKNAIDIMEKCIIVVDQSANLNVTIDSSNTYITRDSAERNYVKKTDYATENKAGIVTLGTTTNTALEGSRLAEIIGMEFGGNIQDTGIKTAGKFYYDTVTKFYYECIVINSLTYNDATKFRAISNKPISDKVESLSEVKEYVFAINGLTNGKIVKIGKLVHLTIDSGTHFYNKGAEAVVLNIPQGFRPKNLVNFSAVNLSNVPNSFRIATNGNVIKVFTDSKNGAYYFSVTYFTD